LISNAFKATPSGKRIAIILAEKDKSIRLEVKNEGQGLPEEKLKNLFRQYERQTSMQNQHKAQEGLGLAIVHKYTTAMNGKVWVESEKNGETVFYVEFPLTKVMSKA
jgi:signal transduction histidine kinase